MALHRALLALSLACLPLAALVPGAAALPPGTCAPPYGPSEGESIGAGVTDCQVTPAASCQYAWAAAVLYDPRGNVLAGGQAGASACTTPIVQGTWTYDACVGLDVPRVQGASQHHAVCVARQASTPPRQGVCASTTQDCVLADGAGNAYTCQWRDAYAGQPTGCTLVTPPTVTPPPPTPHCSPPQYACVVSAPPCTTAWAGTSGIAVGVEACGGACPSASLRVDGPQRAGVTCDPACPVYVGVRCVPP